jgi:uncharacterized membrane protein YphA (DoxX/SURF4 family)
MTTFEDSRLSSPYWALRVTFILLPILAGLDKFANVLTYWPHYLSPTFASRLPLAPGLFMRLVGVIEVIAGLLVLSKATRLGAYIVMAWLICVAINLTSMRMFDIAVRDLALAAGAFALARLQEARVGVTRAARLHTATATA